MRRVIVLFDFEVYKRADWGEFVCTHANAHKELVDAFNPADKQLVLTCSNADCTGIEEWEISKLWEDIA